MAKNDTRAAPAARIASSHINLHCYLLSKGKTYSVPLLNKKKIPGFPDYIHFSADG